MAGHPCTPVAGTANDPAAAPVDGHGHQFGLGADQPDYASPPAFRLVWSCCPSRYGDPKGDLLRISSASPESPLRIAGADRIAVP